MLISGILSKFISAHLFVFNNYKATRFFCDFDLSRNANSFVYPSVVSQLQRCVPVLIFCLYSFPTLDGFFPFDMLVLHILFICFGDVDHDFGFSIGVVLLKIKTPLSFLFWKLTPKMGNLLSTVAPHQGPDPPVLYLFSLLVYIGFVPFSLSSQRLWVGIQNKLLLLFLEEPCFCLLGLKLSPTKFNCFSDTILEVQKKYAQIIQY